MRNVTIAVIIGLLGFVAYKMLTDQKALAAGSGINTAHPGGGSSNTESPDVVSSISNAVGSIFSAVGAIAQSQPKTT